MHEGKRGGGEGVWFSACVKWLLAQDGVGTGGWASTLAYATGFV